jgi:sensor histidine kinase YesM
MLATKGTFAVLGVVVTLGLREIYRRMLRRELPLPYVILLLVTASYVAAIPWTSVYNLADARILEWLTGRTIRNLSLTNGALYHTFVLVSWSVLYLGVRQYAELQDGRERLLRAESLANAARLSALRYQLNPHFLFNTLNAISTLVVDQRTTDATRMLARLSDLLRVTLDDQFSDEVSLAEEIEVLRKYLDIEQVRFGARLTVVFNVSAAAEVASVPPLILQPIVENAIRHGIARREAGGTISVSAHCENGWLRLVVDDDGPGFDRARNAGVEKNGQSAAAHDEGLTPAGIGLNNCRERLRAIYGEQQRMSVTTSERGGVRVTLEIPMRRAQSAHQRDARA